MGRDEDLAGTFVSLAEMLTGEYDLQRIMEELVDRCSSLVEAAAVGVMMVDDAGELRLTAASTEDMNELELLEMQQQEGPCYDAFRTGEQVNANDLATSAERWPQFTPKALEFGYRAAHAFPLRVRDERLGALNVFFPHTGPFSQSDLHALQALADVAAMGIAQQHTISRRRGSHQQAVLDLSHIALFPLPLEQVYEAVCTTVTRTLEVPLCQIHEFDASGRLVHRAGVGWDPPLEPADTSDDSPYARAVRQREPVVLGEPSCGAGFDDPTLESHGVVSGVSVAIPGEPRPFGALSVYTRERRDFDSGEVIFLGSVATLLGSVVARHAAETQLRRAHRFDSVGQLATGIAHDFNNLLAIINGNATLLAMESPSPQLDAILTAGDQAQRQVSRLLTFGRQQQPHIAPIDLNELVNTTVAMIGQTIGSSIQLEVDLADDIPTVAADASQLEQAIVNLIVNARDAMPDGGTLRVCTQLPLYMEAAQAGEPTRVQLIVSDTGVGMNEDVLARAFDPYFTTKGQQGTGLGLAAVYGAIDAVHGRIDVDSEPGRGTTFTIDLPASQPAGSEARSDQGPAAHA